LGCGTAQILSVLPEGVDYWGYDVSAEYIAAATARFGSRGHFVCGSPEESEIASMPSFDIVVASAVLHHLDDTEARQLLRLARCALRAGGHFASIDAVFSPGQSRIARFLIDRDRGQNVRSAEGYLKLARPEFDRVEGTVRHRAWIPYTHWVMECTVDPSRRWS
jgi:SAM-dependent methyltransferase